MKKKNNSPFYVWKYWAVKKKKKKERNRGKPLYTELDVVYVKPVNKLQFNIVEVEYNKAICSYVRKQSI